MTDRIEQNAVASVGIDASNTQSEPLAESARELANDRAGRGSYEGEWPKGHARWAEEVRYLLDDLATALEHAADEKARLRKALQQVKDRSPRVCAEYETCDHVGCQASHEAFAIAEEALKPRKFSEAELATIKEVCAPLSQPDKEQVLRDVQNALNRRPAVLLVAGRVVRRFLSLLQRGVESHARVHRRHLPGLS